MNEDRTMIKVLPRMVEEWIGMEDICFVTGKIQAMGTSKIHLGI